jgi:hypothetical protein
MAISNDEVWYTGQDREVTPSMKDSISAAVRAWHVSALVTIACQAGPSEVGLFAAAAVLGGNNVIGFVTYPGIFFVKQAIFTAALRPVANQDAQRGRHHLTHQ